MRRAAPALAALGLVLAAGGCGKKAGNAQPIATLAPFRITLASPAFADGGRLPGRYSCDGDGSSPPLRWTRPPPRTRQLALTLEDSDAPGGTFVHWLVYGLDARARALPAGT